MPTWPYQRGYTTRNYHVTGGHEASAEAAERAKKPTRIGLFVLRLLGYRGSVTPRPRLDRVSPGHQHGRPPSG